jgi:hypothetical protein
MAVDHYANLINSAIELIIYSDGGITLNDVENMSADELGYFIYNFKKTYEDKQKSRQEFIKTIFDYANKALDTLFKLLKSLGGGK